MTVAELIEELKKQDPNATVMYDSGVDPWLEDLDTVEDDGESVVVIA